MTIVKKSVTRYINHEDRQLIVGHDGNGLFIIDTDAARLISFPESMADDLIAAMRAAVIDGYEERME